MKTKFMEGIIVALVVLGLLVFVILIIANTNLDKATKSFDNQFKSGQLVFAGNTIKFGEQGNPNKGNLPGFTPDIDNNTLDTNPRLVRVTDCTYVKLPDRTGLSGVEAVTPYFNPTDIIITVPEKTSGVVNICVVPDNVRTEVLIWAK